MNYIKEVQILFDIFNNSSYELYLIGGSVRDILLYNKTIEYDFTTNATPTEVVKLLDKFETNIYKKELGLTIVKINNISFEITTMRKEKGVRDYRYPKKIKFISSLKKDSFRRDFTINAIAYNPKFGLIDYQNGKEDLDNKIIRFIGRPTKRIKEDPLRILRAIRFSSKLDFLIEEQSLKAINKYAYLVSNLNDVRFRELFKICNNDNAIKTFIKYEYVLKQSFPELKNSFNAIINSNLIGDSLIILIMKATHYLEKYDTAKKYKNILKEIENLSFNESIDYLTRCL